MLKNRYQEIIIGSGPLSLVRAIISCRKGKSTLLIDDKRFSLDSYPGLFLSELEVRSLIRLGRTYDIPELKELKQFLTEARIDLVSSQTRVEIGLSPLKNIKEILRKYPELIDESDLDLVFSESEDAFNDYFQNELLRFEALNMASISKPKSGRYEFQGPKWLRLVYQRFGELLNEAYDQSRSLKYSALLHLLGLVHEERLKTSLAPDEIPFYFFRTFSRIYRLQDFFLTTQLKRRLNLLGGDFKESVVQFWQFHEKKFENLLLASFEGVISGQRVLFFSHLPGEVPFSIRSPYGIFRKTRMAPLKRQSAPFPPGRLTFLCDLQLLGSDRPFRVVAQGAELAFYDWPYPDMPGSKSEFYYRDLKRSFESDQLLLPFKAETSEVTTTASVTLDLRSLKASKNKESSLLRKLPIEIIFEDYTIQGLEYWGPFRYYSQGLLGLIYGIEGA